MEEIVQALFLVHSIRADAVDKGMSTEEYFTINEVEEAVLPMKAKKYQTSWYSKRSVESCM